MKRIASAFLLLGALFAPALAMAGDGCPCGEKCPCAQSCPCGEKCPCPDCPCGHRK